MSITNRYREAAWLISGCDRLSSLCNRVKWWQWISVSPLKGRGFKASIWISMLAFKKVACASPAGNMVCEVCKASVRSTAVISMSKHLARTWEVQRAQGIDLFHPKKGTFSRNWRGWDMVSTLCTLFLITVTIVSVLVFCSQWCSALWGSVIQMTYFILYLTAIWFQHCLE